MNDEFDLLDFCKHHAQRINYGKGIKNNHSLYKQARKEIKQAGYSLNRVKKGDLNALLQTTISIKARTSLLIKQLKINKDLRAKLLKELEVKYPSEGIPYRVHEGLYIKINRY